MQINNGIVQGILRVLNKIIVKDVQADTLTMSGNVEGHRGVFYGDYNGTTSTRYRTSALEIRENGKVSSAQSDIGYAPTVGFHWSGRIAATLAFHSDGNFYFRKQDGTSRATIDANVNGNASTATTATKVGTATVGGTTTPIYLNAGTPTALGYTIAKSVPSNAVFTDTTYSTFVKSGSGAKAGLVPAPSTTAGTTKYLREDGTWQTPPDNNTWRGVQNNLTSTATDQSLSAAQGKALNDKFGNYLTTSGSRYLYGNIRWRSNNANTSISHDNWIEFDDKDGKRFGYIQPHVADDGKKYFRISGDNDGLIFTGYSWFWSNVGISGTLTVNGAITGTASAANTLAPTESGPATINYNLKTIDKMTYSITSSNTTGRPSQDSGIITMPWLSGAWGGQIALGSVKNNHLYIRGSADENGNSSWEDWKTVLDSTNYGLYAASAGHTHAYSSLTGRPVFTLNGTTLTITTS